MEGVGRSIAPCVECRIAAWLEQVARLTVPDRRT